MTNALIGYSGFVGTTLLKQASFSELYRSSNIGDIEGRSFDTLVCAGAPAQKWIANRDPEADLENIMRLIGRLQSCRCKAIVLISTIDVFRSPLAVDEETAIDEAGLHAYGVNRRLLETFVESYFPKHLIVRLPGLVGPGLRKNVIFDLLNGNNIHAIDSRSVFQFYPMVNLWYDIQIALDHALRLIHLTAAPVSVGELARQCFGISFNHLLAGTPATYDMRSRHSEIFGGEGGYLYSLRESIQAIRAYAQSEPSTSTLAPKDAA